MARLARTVFEGVPHHVTQRGNARQQTFFSDSDFQLYRNMLAEHAGEVGVEVWAWVLMPNHVHLILTPPDPDALRRCLAPLHRRYAGTIHAREGRSGHFWQGRFGCVPMDERHFSAAVPYVVLNPVRAGLVKQAVEWRWSSIHAHLDPERGDGLTTCAPVKNAFPDFEERIAAGEDQRLSRAIRQAETIGKPFSRNWRGYLADPWRPASVVRKVTDVTTNFGDSALNWW